MKTIKEQYKEIVSGWNDERTDNVANKCTEIANDYAIQFAEWLMDCHISELTLKEFKKEKGL